MAAALPQGAQIHPISALSPFMGTQRQWIRARVSDKMDTIKTWNNANGSGKLFSCVLNDETCSIRATFFNGAADNYFQTLQNGQVYIFGGMSVKTAKRQFNNVNNDYECSFDEKSEVHACNQNNAAIPMSRYNFVPVSVIKNKEKNTKVDVLAVVKSVGEISSITSREKGEEMQRRTIQLCDQSGQVDLALWREQIHQCDVAPGQVVALRNVRKSDWDGCSLGWSFDAQCAVDPKGVDTDGLRRWWGETQGANVQNFSVRDRQSGGDGASAGNSNYFGRQFLSFIDDNRLGYSEKNDIVEVYCSVSKMKFDGNYSYDACAGEKCNKKVIDSGNGTYRCEKCDRTYPHCVPRFMFDMEISDHVSQRYVQVYDEGGKQFWQMTAGELKAKLANNEIDVSKYLQKLFHQPMIVKLRVKEETYTSQKGDDAGAEKSRVKCTVQSIDRVMKDAMPGDDGVVKFAPDSKMFKPTSVADEIDMMMSQIRLYS